MQKTTFTAPIPHIISRLYLQSLHSLRRHNHKSITSLISRFFVHETFSIKSIEFIEFLYYLLFFERENSLTFIDSHWSLPSRKWGGHDKGVKLSFPRNGLHGKPRRIYNYVHRLYKFSYLYNFHSKIILLSIIQRGKQTGNLILTFVRTCFHPSWCHLVA
jgi:hypothetical protein